MAKRFEGSFYTTRGVNLRVDIYDTDHGGAATTFDVKSVDIVYDSQNNDDYTSPIVGSRANISMVIPTADATLTAFVEDFATSDTERFFLELVKVSDSSVLFRGIFLADSSSEEDTAPSYIFKISAACGLAMLKKRPYHDGGLSPAILTGVDRFTEHMSYALAKLPHTSTFWGPTDVFLKTAVDWWAVSMASTATDDALFQGGADHSAFYDYKTKEGGVDKDVLSCYDVLWHILKTFECRMYQIDGVWWVEQIAYRTNATFYSRHYTKLGAYLSNETVTGTHVITQALQGTKVATMQYDFVPPLWRAQVTYDVKTRRNYFGLTNADQFTTIPFGQTIDATGGTSICRVSGKVHYKITNNSAAIQWNFLLPKFKLQVGSYYLSRTFDITNFGSYQPPCSWSNISGSRVYVPMGPFLMPSVGNFEAGSFEFDMLAPPLLGDGDTSNQLTFYADELRDWQGVLVSTGYSLEWSVSDLFFEVYDNGTPGITEDQVTYGCVGASSSEQYETTVRLGTATLANSAGRIMRYTGAAWEAATNWGQGVDTRDKAIGTLLAQNLLNARLTMRRRMNGTIFGDVNPKKVLQDSDGKRWLFNNLTWNVGDNTLTGTWFELEYGAAGVNSTPVKIKLIHNGQTFPPVVSPNNPTGTNTGNQGLNVNPSPTVLAPVSYNALDTAIDEGDTVTSIPIKTASAGSEFLAGDSVGLVNPINGQFQYFEIQTAPTAGATSLSVVSEVAAYDFPEDSYLIISQKPYAFSLPDATQGQILRFNGTSGVWESYSGATDGHVLTWDTTNGWQAEASTGGVSDGDKGDITVTASGATWTIDNNVVTDAKFRQGVARSVVGVTGNATANVADIQGTADQVLAVNTAGTALAFGQVQTAGIAASAVTYAKIQNVSATTRWLGRITAGAGVVEELTLANMYTMLGMTGTANRFALWTGANTLSSDAAFTFDAANDRMTITGTVAGSGANNAFLNLNSGAISGTTEFLRMRGNITGNMIATIDNENNLAGSNTILQLRTGGAVAADPVIQFSVAGVISHAIGLDNSDGDKFKITPNSSTPGGTANSGLIITNAAAALVGINKDAPAHPLDVSGRAMATEFINTSNPPTAGAAGAGLGTGGAIGVISGGNNGFQIPFTVGTAPTNNGAMFTITYQTAYTTSSYPTFSPGGAATANEMAAGKYYFSDTSGVSFTMTANGTLTTGDYILIFNVFGR